MANSYYGLSLNNSKISIPFYAVHIAVQNHLADMLFNGDHSRIVIAANDYAFRKRADSNKSDGTLNLPFLNFRRSGWDFSGTGRWSSHGFTSGVYIPELGKKLKINPIAIDFQCSLFNSMEIDNQEAFHRLRNDADSETKFLTIIEIDGYEVSLMTYFEYVSLNYDPDWEEKDWLEQNKIRGISLDFRVHLYDVTIPDTCNVCITEKVLFDFVATHGLDDTTSYEEAMEFLVNHFDETITPV